VPTDSSKSGSHLGMVSDEKETQFNNGSQPIIRYAIEFSILYINISYK
jgi:hypothetical protein